jgi:hypothetical protein
MCYKSAATQQVEVGQSFQLCWIRYAGSSVEQAHLLVEVGHNELPYKG